MDEGNNENTGRRWQASLDTDILEFFKKEGFPTDGLGKKDNRIPSNIGYILERTYRYGPSELKTIRDLVAMPKNEFLDCVNSWTDRIYKKEEREEYWREINKVLKRHGYRMYVKGRVFDG